MWNGLSFVAKHEYGYDQRETFILYLAAGVIYVLGAFAAGPITRRLGAWMSPRTMLLLMLALQGLAFATALVRGPSWPMWLTACLSSAMGSLMWPVVESFITAGRHGPAMRAALGWWNVSWTSGVAVSLFMMAPLVAAGAARLSIAALAPLMVVCIGLLRWFPVAPATHDEQLATAARTPEYPMLLQTARVLLPASYLLIGALSPILPFELARLGVALELETPIGGVWVTVRVIAIAVLWRTAFWHGRWGTHLVGAALLVAGFTGVVLAPSLPVLLASLVLFGVGHGIVYYAAIYYAMSVGHAAVDAGGTHEGLIGVGYALGPAVGLAGLAIGGAAAWAPWTIGATFALLAIGLPPGIAPYLRARRGRRQSTVNA